MTPNTTFLDAMRDAADAAGAERGFRFYSSPHDSEFASYAQLELQGRADAAALAAHGHRPGEVVVLAFEPGLGFIRSLYAAFAAGLVAAPVPVAAMRHPEVARQRLEAIIADSGSRLVLTEGAALLPLGIVDGDSVAGARVVEVSTLAGAVDDWRPPAIGSDSLALLQYTSGSTGVPKGVMVSHGNLVANEAAITGAVGITAASRTMGWLPHYHDMGLVGQLLQPHLGRRRQRADLAEPVPPTPAALAPPDLRAPLHAHGGSRLRVRALHPTRHRRAAGDARPVRARGGHHRGRAGAQRHARRVLVAVRPRGVPRRGVRARATAWPRPRCS